MKRFKYRLERVLHFRTLVEAQAKRALQLAQRELLEGEAELKYLQDELLKEFGADGREHGIRVEEFLLVQSYRSGLRVRIAAQLEEIERRRAVVVKRMEEYQLAARELESLQRHRRGKLTEYDHEVSLAEQAQIDELTVQRHGRH
jgi:flagellar FliJ protein